MECEPEEFAASVICAKFWIITEADRINAGNELAPRLNHSILD